MLEGRKTIATGVLLLVIAAAAASLFFHRSEGTPRINLNPYQALGAVAAEETSRLLQHQGEIVVVVNDPGDGPDPVLDAQLKTFTRSLKQAGKIAIDAIERVKMDSLTAMATGGTMPPDQFTRLTAKHPRADAYVLFIGFPMLRPSEINTLKSGKTKFIVVSAALPGYRELLRAGIIDLAIVPKTVVTHTNPAKPGSLHDWFALDYQIVTPATADLLPF